MKIGLLAATISLAALTDARPLYPQRGAGDTPITVTLRKRFAIGGENDTSFAVPRLFPQNVAVDAAGHLYLVDRPNFRVNVYDTKGRRINTLGRKGGGPGEFQNPNAVGATADGAVTVADLGKRTFVSFNVAGAPQPEVSTRAIGTVQRIVAITPQSTVVWASRGDSSMVVRLTGATQQILVIEPPVTRKEVKGWEKCGLIGQETAPVLTSNLLVGGDRSVAVSNVGGDYRILVNEEGKPARTVTRAKPLEKATADLARRIRGDSTLIVIGGRPCSIALTTIIEEAGLAATVPAYSALAVDRQRNIWAVRTTPQSEPGMADLYSIDRGYVGTASIGRAHPIAFLSDGALVSIELDESDVPMVVVYDVVIRP